MNSESYYNEIDPFAADWLENLIAAGHIAPGIVDRRSIVDVEPQDLAGFTQCHFFAGIGGWSYALRLAVWPDSRPVWTGSPPCQPFSTAGKQLGMDDPRHLAPHWLELIRACRPERIFGEQVAAAIAHGWLDDLQDALAAENYASGAIVLPACSVGAPHIRQRLWFVAQRMGVASESRLEGYAGHVYHRDEPGRESAQPGGSVTEAGGAGRMADADSEKQQYEDEQERRCNASRNVGAGRMADAERHRHNRSEAGATKQTRDKSGQRIFDRDSPSIDGQSRSSPFAPGWNNTDWLFCRDGKWRPVEPGTFPLASRVSVRVGRLRAYGNSIVPQVAAEVIRAVM